MNKETFSQRKILSQIPYFIILLILASSLSRFFQLGRESVWLDEALSLSISKDIEGLHLENYLFFSNWGDTHPPFYYFVLHFWRGLFGTSEVSLRGLSAVCGVLVVISTYYVGSKLIDRKTAIISSLLVLVNPVALYFSQEARMYTLTSLLILLSAYFFYKLLSNRRKRYSILYVLVSTLLIYTHYLGILLLGAELFFFLIWFSFLRDRKKLKMVISSYLVILCLYIPWVPNVLVRLDWQQISWMEPPTLGWGISVITSLLGIEIMHLRVTQLVSVLGSVPTYLIYAVLGVIGGLTFTVGLLRSFWEKTTFKTLLAVLCFVPAIMFLISVVQVPIFNLRQASVYLPEVALITSIGLVTLSGKVCQRFGLTLANKVLVWFLVPLLLANLVGTYRVYTVDTKRNWRRIAGKVESIAEDKPVVVFPSKYAAPFKYYQPGGTQIIPIEEEIPLLSLQLLEDYYEFILILPERRSSQDLLASLAKEATVRHQFDHQGIAVYSLRKKSMR